MATGFIRAHEGCLSATSLIASIKASTIPWRKGQPVMLPSTEKTLAERLTRQEQVVHAWKCGARVRSDVQRCHSPSDYERTQQDCNPTTTFEGSKAHEQRDTGTTTMMHRKAVTAAILTTLCEEKCKSHEIEQHPTLLWKSILSKSETVIFHPITATIGAVSPWFSGAPRVTICIILVSQQWITWIVKLTKASATRQTTLKRMNSNSSRHLTNNNLKHHTLVQNHSIPTILG